MLRDTQCGFRVLRVLFWESFKIIKDYGMCMETTQFDTNGTTP